MDTSSLQSSQVEKRNQLDGPQGQHRGRQYCLYPWKPLKFGQHLFHGCTYIYDSSSHIRAQAKFLSLKGQHLYLVGGVKPCIEVDFITSGSAHHLPVKTLKVLQDEAIFCKRQTRWLWTRKTSSQLTTTSSLVFPPFSCYLYSLHQQFSQPFITCLDKGFDHLTPPRWIMGIKACSYQRCSQVIYCRSKSNVPQ